MDPVVLVMGLIAVMLLGLGKRIHEQVGNVKKAKFVGQYLEKYVKFANAYFESKPFDNKRYNWLLTNADEAQERLGSIGLLEYSAPYGRFTASDYPILVNTVLQFGQSDGPHHVDASTVDAVLRRALGQYDRVTKSNISELKNPLKWLTTGVMTLLAFPILVLRDTGIMSASLAYKIIRSKLLRLTAGLISLIGIAETTLGLIAGKSLVIQAISQVMKWMG